MCLDIIIYHCFSRRTWITFLTLLNVVAYSIFAYLYCILLARTEWPYWSPPGRKDVTIQLIALFQIVCHSFCMTWWVRILRNRITREPVVYWMCWMELPVIPFIFLPFVHELGIVLFGIVYIYDFCIESFLQGWFLDLTEEENVGEQDVPYYDQDYNHNNLVLGELEIP